MNQIANRKERYQSRSKKNSNSRFVSLAKEGEKRTREKFKVDCNGYFLWDAEGEDGKTS